MDKRLRFPNKTSMRNLSQYKDMTDKEFDEIYSQIMIGANRDSIQEEKIHRMINQFEEEYDLSELLPNDRIVLRNLVSSMIRLEDFDNILNNIITATGVTDGNILIIDKVSKVCEGLRSDISKMQDDLKITRKIRKSDKEQSVLNFIEELKKNAKTFYQQKMQYIFCERCGQLLATIWWQHPEINNNSIKVECKKIQDNEQPCGWTKKFTAKEISELGGSNRTDLMPESMK